MQTAEKVSMPDCSLAVHSSAYGDNPNQWFVYLGYTGQ